LRTIDCNEELQRVLAADRAKVLDLPPLPLARRVN
jgi:hypothetical protein